MYTEQDALVALKITDLWSKRRWSQVMMLIDMNIRCRKMWFSNEFIDDMKLLRSICDDR